VGQGGPGATCKWPCNGVFDLPALLARLAAHLRAAWNLATVRVLVIVEGGIMSEKALRIIVALPLVYLSPVAASAFHLQEATIADIHRHPGQGTDGDDDCWFLPLSESTPIMNNTSKATWMPASCLAMASRSSTLGALMTLNPKQALQAADSAPNMPDALETARVLDDALPQPPLWPPSSEALPQSCSGRTETFALRDRVDNRDPL
jgi:hypothetical protein